MFSAHIHDTLSGAHLLSVRVQDLSWSSKLDGSAAPSAAIPVRSLGIPRAVSRDLFRANARTLVVADEFGTVAAAGVMLTPKYDLSAGTVSVQTVDVREFLRQRLGLGVDQWGPSWNLTVTGRSLSGAARAIIRRGVAEGGPFWNLPVDLPPDGSGSFTRTWPFYGFATLDDMLREVEAEGAEVFFDPYLTGGSLRWAARVGSPIVGASFDLTVTAPGSRVVGLTVTEDGSKQLTGVIYAGNGMDADKVTAYAGSGPYDIPIRDAYRSMIDVRDPAQLGRIAAAELARYRNPLVQWSFSVQLDDTVRAEHVKPGRLLRMDVRRDDWIPDGVYTQRVIGASGGTGNRVSVEVQAYGG